MLIKRLPREGIHPLKASSWCDRLIRSLFSLIPPGLNILQILIAVYTLVVGTGIAAGLRVAARRGRVHLRCNIRLY